jgi:uncharacterized membrane protein
MPLSLYPLISEIVLTATALGLLAFYHVRLYRQVQRHPLTTAVGVTNHARRAWVRSVMDGRRDLLAVQTIRNWTMASTFLASTAVLISLGLLAAVFRPDVVDHAAHGLNLFGHPSPTLWSLKLLVLSVLFFFGFFNFTLAVRYYNHASLMINVPPALEPSATVDTVTAILNHGALHYTLGMRGFYLAIPMGLWLFGPLWMLGGAALLVAVLHRLDREV